MSTQASSDAGGGRARSPLAWLLLLPVRLWRLMAPIRAPRCRFYPSCSAYAVQAISTHGAVRGGVLAARRVGRCHPWNPGGIDHVPDPDDQQAWRHHHHRSSPTTK